VPLSDTGSSPRFDLARDLSLAHAIDPRLAGNSAPDLALDLALNRPIPKLPTCEPSLDSLPSACLPDERAVVCDSVAALLQQLKEQLPSPEQGGERLKEWWNANGQTWAEKLKFDTSLPQHRSSMAVQRSAEGSAEAILRFHTVAVHCLSGCEVTPPCEKIEEKLLLPIAESEKRLQMWSNIKSA